MNIVIVGNFHYPFGSASASRMRHFAKGFLECGCKVRVISLIDTYDRPDDVCPDGQRRYEGVFYESMQGYNWQPVKKKRTLSDKYKWYRNFRYAVQAACRRIERLHQDEKIDFIIQYNRSAYAIFHVVATCRRCGIISVEDVVEWPDSSFFWGGICHPRYWEVKLGLHKVISKADGVIGISRFITDKYSRKSMPTVRIPSVIEVPDQPANADVEHEPNACFTATYLGTLRPADAPYEMVNAIKLLREKGAKVKMRIVGNYMSSLIGTSVKEYCQADPILSKAIHFTGRVSDEQVKRELTSADTLLFMRQESASARAAFPTRLPEYLVTGVPAIVSGVGDICSYLEDGRDAMVVEPPCNPEKIAAKIEQLMQMPDRGKSLGTRGCETADKCFNFKTRAQQILEFVQDLQTSSNDLRKKSNLCESST